MQYESKDLLSLKKRIEQVRKNKSKNLLNESKRDLFIIRLLERLSDGESIKRGSKLENEMENFIIKKMDVAEEDSEIIRYKSWIEKKLALLKR
jgi:hypothetical protein